MPEGGHHYVLNGAVFAVGEFHLHLAFLFAHTPNFPTNRARLFRAFARQLTADFAWPRGLGFAGARTLTAFRTRFFFLWRAVPFRILPFPKSSNLSRGMKFISEKSIPDSDKRPALMNGTPDFV